jgi:hypothetical protein
LDLLFRHDFNFVCEEDLLGLRNIQKIPKEKRFTSSDLKKDIREISEKDILQFFKE